MSCAVAESADPAPHVDVVAIADEVVSTVVVSAHQNHAEHDRLKDRGDEPEDHSDFRTDLVSEIRADGALTEVDANGEEEAGRCESEWNGTRDAAVGAAFGRSHEGS